MKEVISVDYTLTEKEKERLLHRKFDQAPGRVRIWENFAIHKKENPALEMYKYCFLDITYENGYWWILMYEKGEYAGSVNVTDKIIKDGDVYHGEFDIKTSDRIFHVCIK